jgi:excisionase family DNA binding protein
MMTKKQTPGWEPLLTPAEVAAIFRVDVKTVTKWGASGRLPCLRTLGGHRRYREADVYALLAGNVPDPHDEGGVSTGVLVGVPLAGLVAVAAVGHEGPDGRVLLGVMVGLVLLAVGFRGIGDETPTDACDERCDR